MKRFSLIAGILLVLAFVAFRILDPQPVRDTRAAYTDYLQRYQPREYTPMPVRIVDIDEESLSAMGQWPWSRIVLAGMVARLRDLGAAVVVFDVLFAEQDRLSPSKLVQQADVSGLFADGVTIEDFEQFDSDERFANVIGSTNVVLGSALIPGRDNIPISPKSGLIEVGPNPTRGLFNLASVTPVLPVLQEKATGIGIISVSPLGNSSGLVRTVPLLWNSSKGVVPSLSVEALRLAMGEASVNIWNDTETDGVVSGVSIGQFFIPTTPDGQIWIRYRHEEPEVYVPAKDILLGDFNELVPKIQGHIVFVGTSAAGLLDIRNTALGESVPGVSIHAQIIEQILQVDYLTRNDLIEGIEVLAILISGLILVVLITFRGPLVSLITFVAIMGLAVAASWLAFDRYGALVDITYLAGSGFLLFTSLSAYKLIVTDRDKRLIRRSFAHYVSSEILHEIEKTGQGLSLGGVTRPLTIMFCDIRNFTPLSESLEAQDLVTLLNDYFDSLGQAIMSEGGTIDKFIGDAIMAFWNAPLEVPDHSRRGCKAALKMREALRGFNERSGRAPIGIGIGLDCGPANVGNIGSRDRFNYSVIGTTVNQASRIESSAKHVAYDIVVSENVRAEIEDYATLEAGSLTLKGVSKPVQTHIIVGNEETKQSPEFEKLESLHKAVIAHICATRSVDPEMVQACREAARPLHDGLDRFFEQLLTRVEDFRPREVQSEAAEI